MGVEVKEYCFTREFSLCSWKAVIVRGSGGRVGEERRRLCLGERMLGDERDRGKKGKKIMKNNTKEESKRCKRKKKHCNTNTEERNDEEQGRRRKKIYRRNHK